jgi:hypothetical protein
LSSGSDRSSADHRREHIRWRLSSAARPPRMVGGSSRPRRIGCLHACADAVGRMRRPGSATVFVVGDQSVVGGKSVRGWWLPGEHDVTVSGGRGMNGPSAVAVMTNSGSPANLTPQAPGLVARRSRELKTARRTPSGTSVNGFAPMAANGAPRPGAAVCRQRPERSSAASGAPNRHADHDGRATGAVSTATRSSRHERAGQPGTRDGLECRARFSHDDDDDGRPR